MNFIANHYNISVRDIIETKAFDSFDKDNCLTRLLWLPHLPVIKPKVKKKTRNIYVLVVFKENINLVVFCTTFCFDVCFAAQTRERLGRKSCKHFGHIISIWIYILYECTFMAGVEDAVSGAVPLPEKFDSAWYAATCCCGKLEENPPAPANPLEFNPAPPVPKPAPPEFNPTPPKPDEPKSLLPNPEGWLKPDGGWEKPPTMEKEEDPSREKVPELWLVGWESAATGGVVKILGTVSAFPVIY